jgi:acetyl esterase/lipase
MPTFSACTRLHPIFPARPARCRHAAAVLMVLVATHVLLVAVSAFSPQTLGGTGGRSLAAAVGEPRDWSQVQLAWRDDPRAVADAPSGVEVRQPAPRRPSRRSQRRAAARRRMPLDDVPIDVRPSGAANFQSDASRPSPASPHDPLEAEPPLRQPEEPASIPVETTLSSPFTVPAGDKTSTLRDQPYGTGGHSRQRFDLYLPAGCGSGGLPLVVWIHGDSWRDGSRSDCPVRWLVDEGYAVASVGYRLSDTAVFPAQLDDCRAAVADLERNAEVWGIDRDRICVAGVAAGGHLAALVGLSAPPRVAAVCAMAAPTHLTTLGPEHDRSSSAASLLVGGPLPEFREAAQQASPLTHVSVDDPPVLIVHHRLDPSVPADQAVRLDAALRAAGCDSALLLLEGEAHRPALERSAPAGHSLLEFLDRTLGPGIRPPAEAATAPPPGSTRTGGAQPTAVKIP